ncbi:MAG: hypothetical protein CSB55_09210, partial [Candidatus Cloacimonadota bacterium]
MFKKTFTATALFLLLLVSVYAQDTWVTNVDKELLGGNYYDYPSSEFTNVIPAPDGGYIISAYVYPVDFEFSFEYIGFFKINSAGEPEEPIEICPAYSFSARVRNLIFDGTDRYYALVSRNSAADLMVLNENLELLETISIKSWATIPITEHYDYFHDMKLTDDGIIIVSGDLHWSNPYNYFFKTNYEGNIIWSHETPDYELRSLAESEDD